MVVANATPYRQYLHKVGYIVIHRIQMIYLLLAIMVKCL